jgi:hypothetical protein
MYHLQELRFALQFVSTKEVITVPYSVAVMCAIVECRSLQSHHRVDSSNMQEQNIAKHINTLGANHLRELDLSHMEGVRFLSTPIEALSFTLLSLSLGDTTPVCAPVELELEVNEGGTAHAVCYWYKLIMSPPNRGADHNTHINEINTGPSISNSSNDADRQVSTSRAPKHWRQAATLLKTPTVFDIGDTIVVDISVSLSFGVCVRCSD